MGEQVQGYQVDADELTHAANTVRALAADLAASVGLKYSIAVNEVGSEELAQALAEFHDQSRRRTSALHTDAIDAAARLRDTSATYQLHDQSAAAAIAGRHV